MRVHVILTDIHKRNRVQRVSRIGRTVRVEGVVAVAVVGNDDDLISVLQCRLNHLVRALVDTFDRFHDCVIHTRMSDHVAVREIEGDIVEFLRLDSCYQRFRHLRSTHLRLQVVRRHFRTRNQDPLLTRILCLATAVEEERHMSEFLRLSNAKLLHSQPADHFA